MGVLGLGPPTPDAGQVEAASLRLLGRPVVAKATPLVAPGPETPTAFGTPRRPLVPARDTRTPVVVPVTVEAVGPARGLPSPIGQDVPVVTTRAPSHVGLLGPDDARPTPSRPTTATVVDAEVAVPSVVGPVAPVAPTATANDVATHVAARLGAPAPMVPLHAGPVDGAATLLLARGTAPTVPQGPNGRVAVPTLAQALAAEVA